MARPPAVAALPKGAPASSDRALRRATARYLSRARAQPFVKWAGGKRALVPEILKLLPSTFGNYWEPFVGGGAVFFALADRIRRAHLSDLNLDLILTYVAVRDHTNAVIKALEEHANKHNRRHYLRVRDKMHDVQELPDLAARFIYLNKTCYNGLYRVNKSGKFNVPVGSYKNPTICDEENLWTASKVLSKADVKCWQFDQIKPAEGDLVYCDPPYDGTFVGYTGNGFDAGDQKRLRDACMQWRAVGAHVIISNNNTERIRSLYQNFTLHKVSAPRHINSNGNGRGPTPELLIVG